MSGGLTSTGFTALTTAQVQSSIEQDELAAIDPALNLSATQPLGQINGVFASQGAGLWALIQAVYAAFDPDVATGVQLDAICALTGVTRLPATATLVVCNATLTAGTYAAGTLKANISGYPQYTFTNRDSITSPGGLVSGLYWVCTQTGPIPANSGTLTVITNPVAGWSTITNPTNGTLGMNVETDTALRLRRNQLGASTGNSTVDALRAALILVAGVIQAFVIDNPNPTADGNGTNPYSYQPVIWDGSSPAAGNNAIAQAIWNNKPSGMTSSSASATTGQAIDAAGATHTLAFTRATQVPIYFVLTVKTTNATAFNAGGGPALIQAAMVALGLLLQIGGTVVAVAFESAAFSISGVIDVTSFTLGTAPSPVGTVNILIGATSQATVSSANITITVT